MKYKYIYFDLDGTLIDSSQGVVNSALYSLAKHNMSTFSIDELKKILIGPPLYEGLKTLTGSTDEKLLQSLVQSFREDYSSSGVYQNSLFEGIEILLKKLKEIGCHIEILTSKPEKFALEIIKQHGIEEYFVKIDGAGEHDKKSSKAQKLKKTTSQNREESIMIGDRVEDILAGQSCDVDTLAVTYGFDSLNLLIDQNPTYLVNSVMEIESIIKGK